MKRSRRKTTIDPEPATQLGQSARDLWDGLSAEQRDQVYDLADRALEVARDTFSTPAKRRGPLARLRGR